MRTLLITSVVTASTLLSVVPTASADTPRCVSHHEYDRVSPGMAMSKVHSIFDTVGVDTGLGQPREVRQYLPCTRNGMVQVVFSPRGRVVSKTANWFGRTQLPERSLPGRSRHDVGGT